MTSRLPRISRPLCLALLLSWSWSAAAVSGPQAAIAQQTPPIFQASTILVEVDVIARDRDGRFVPDLRKEEFEILEDGRPQEVSVVYRVVGPADATSAVPAGGPPLSTPTPQQVQRVIVFFFDQAHIQPGGFERARKAAQEFLQKHFREGDIGGVLNGGTMVNNRLTAAREELDAALSSIKPAPEGAELTRRLRIWPRFSDIVEAWRVTRNERGFNPGPTALDDVTARACAEQPASCSGPGSRAMVEADVRGKAEQIVTEARVLGRQTLNTVTGLANGLARIPGRKTVVMLTSGFFVEDSWGDLRQAAGNAARASVRIYAVDTRGLDRGAASSDILSAASPARPTLSGPAMGDTSEDGPTSLAVDTGGYVVRNENDLVRALAGIDRDTSSYYILGFRTPRPPDGGFRSLEVKVKRPGVSVRARKGYLASATAPPAAATASPSVPGASTTAGAGEASARPAPPRPPDVPGAEEPSTGKAPAGARLTPGPTDVARLEAAGAAATVPESVHKAARAGWEAYQRGDVGRAAEWLRIAAADPAAPAWAHYVLGWAEYASGGFRAATSAWERVRSAVPEFEAVYFDLADGYLQQKEFGKAIAVLRDAGRRWPKDVEVYNAIGVAQAGRGALNDAIGTFEQAVAVAPSDETACYNLAKSLELRYVQQRRLGKVSAQNSAAALLDRDRAVEYYRRTLELGGPNAEAAKEGLKRLGAT